MKETNEGKMTNIDIQLFQKKEKKTLTMAARGDPYMIILRPAPRNPIASIRTSPFKANRVTKMAAARKPTSNIPTRMAVLAWKILIM